jgi:hypothetical protein
MDEQPKEELRHWLPWAITFALTVIASIGLLMFIILQVFAPPPQMVDNSSLDLSSVHGSLTQIPADAAEPATPVATPELTIRESLDTATIEQIATIPLPAGAKNLKSYQLGNSMTKEIYTLVRFQLDNAALEQFRASLPADLSLSATQHPMTSHDSYPDWWQPEKAKEYVWGGTYTSSNNIFTVLIDTSGRTPVVYWQLIQV